jgi:propanol-preferring alcohol dehydrogenase
MRAAVFTAESATPGNWVRVEEVARPVVLPGHVLLKVIACGVCRTDLHIVEGDLKALRSRIIPGHQIVGEVVEGATAELPVGMRVGVGWMGGVDGDCPLCRKGMENLCDHPVFTGYTVDGGYAQFALARADFCYRLPQGMDAMHVAPLLCAGIIGFRSLRVAGVERGDRVGLYGFGSSASLAISVLQAWGCEVYVVTRGGASRIARRRRQPARPG